MPTQIKIKKEAQVVSLGNENGDLTLMQRGRSLIVICWPRRPNPEPAFHRNLAKALPPSLRP